MAKATTSHLSYDPRTNHVGSYEPRTTAVDPDSFMRIVKAAELAAIRASALDNSPSSVAQFKPTTTRLDPGTIKALGQASLNHTAAVLKKDGPNAAFKGKQRSELSPQLRKLYDEVEKKKKEGGIKSSLMGGLGHVLDVLSRGNYGSAEAVSRVWDQSLDKGDSNLQNLGDAFADAGKGFVAGFTGKKKTTYSKVLQHGADTIHAMKEGRDPETAKYGEGHINPIVKGVGGFTLDVLLDPTTYIGVGAVKSVIKGGAKVAEHADEVDRMGSKLYHEYGVMADDINGPVDSPEHLKAYLGHNSRTDVAQLPHGGRARQARVQDALVFTATAKATVYAKELSRFRNIFRAKHAKEYMEVPTDEVVESGLKFMDVPLYEKDVAFHRRYTSMYGAINSKKAVISKQLKEAQESLTKANATKVVGKGHPTTAAQVASVGTAARRALEAKINHLKQEFDDLTLKANDLKTKHDDYFNVSEIDLDTMKNVDTEIARSHQVTDINDQIRKADDEVKRLEKRHARKDEKKAKNSGSAAVKTTETVDGKSVAVNKLDKPSHNNAPDLDAARARHAELVTRREQIYNDVFNDYAARVAPDKGTLIAKLRRESDLGILRRLTKAVDPNAVNLARRELAYRMCEKGDKWHNSVVNKAVSMGDGLAEDIRNLTPLPRPAKHTLKRRVVAKDTTLVNKVSDAEVKKAVDHNAVVNRVAEKEAEAQAREVSEGIGDQLLEMMVRETTPNFKRGLSLKLAIPFTKSNTPDTQKQLFALTLPDAVSKAVGQYVFRDTFKEGLAKWNRFFQSSAGSDPLLSSMRLAYNGGAGHRIEEHAKRLRNMWQKTPPANRRAAFRQFLRYGFNGDEAAGPYGVLVKQIHDEFNALMQVFKNENTHISVSDVNAWLPKKMEFQGLDGADALLPVGSIDWIRAALRHTPEDTDPAELLWHLNIAREKVIVRAAMKDNVREVFGIERTAENAKDLANLVKKHGYKEVPEVGKTHVFPPEVADDISKTFGLMKNQGEINELIRFYDSVLTVYKSTVTMYNPGYHMRNSFGDSFMNYLSGVSGASGIRAYRSSAKVMNAMRGLKSGDPIHDAIMTLDPVQAFNNMPVKPNTFLFKTANGRSVTVEQAQILYHRFGLHTGFVANEFSKGFGHPGSMRATAVGQKLTDANRGVQGLSETREDFFRMAHFLHKLQSSKIKDLELAAEEAAASVRKWLYDYSDFTQIEKQVLLRLIPFYKWTRKSIPLMAETLFAQPGKALMYPKGMRNISASLGYDMGDRNGVIPSSDVIIPEWIRNRGMYPIGEQDGNTVMADAALPFNDTIRTVANPLDSLFSMLTPAIRVPMELRTGTRFYQNIPINDKSEYANSSIPQTAFLQQMLKKGQAGEANGVLGTITDPRTLQFLSGIGLVENTERTMQNELRNQSGKANKAITKINKAKENR